MNLRMLRWGLAGAPILMLGAFAPPPGQRPATLVLQPGSRITIEGTSNLHDWSCTATTLKADIRVQMPDDGSPVPLAVDFAFVEVPVAGIQCNNDKMNAKLAKALRARENPTIAFRATVPRALRPNTSGRVRSTFRAELRVGGVVKTIDLPVEGVVSPDGTLRISGQKPFLMTQFDIKPPTAMLGMLKTANRVTVRFDLIASAANLTATETPNTAARSGELATESRRRKR